MAVTSDILRTWTGPGSVVASLASMGQREDRAAAFLAAGSILVFVAQLPRLSRISALEDIEMGILVANTFMAVLVIWPLVLYGVAAVIHIASRRGPMWQARLALFWAYLAAAPVALLQGLVAGLIGPGLQADLVGSIWILAIVWFTWAGLRGARGAA